ncbi:MAG: 4-alpha-glucanotransferase [Candidatus Omnitrophota bacterium]|jgi:4-alpha-glucanotransferase|nr:MAG: 4-alpha-glucanotransferase [Candidatus Omnitrophota bacterium]
MPVDEFREYLLNTPSGNKWRRIGISKKSGVVVPLFSVYSRNSIGIADTGDIKLLIDWCSSTGNSILQFLPLNEVGSTFCPYDSTSSFALEPAYINLNDIPDVGEKQLGEIRAVLRKIFPQIGPHIDYRIKEEKLKALKSIFNSVNNIGAQDSLAAYIRDNSYWLDDFCLYKLLKNLHNGRPWYEWEPDFRDRIEIRLVELKEKYKKEILFEAWLQWLMAMQLKNAKNYAVKNNIFIKGDLPILVSRDSADVWAHPEFFKLDFASGAPPDMYCAKGQRWGMPTYNWDKIRENNFEYIKEKLKYAEGFYDILRIDHVVGVFRIWSIPYGEPLENQGLHGFFDPADDKLWAGQGREILKVMQESTDMLLCAEDLGTIPAVCPETMKELGIPGNDVQRWVKDWQKRHDFLLPDEFRQLSVAMLSTHDTTNWPGWWQDEAGTVDEALFIRKCQSRSIAYEQIKDRLFNHDLSRHGRLRWRRDIDSADKLLNVLGKPKEELADFIEMYENSFMEKEKLWAILKFKGPVREKADSALIKAVFKFILDSEAIFCINIIFDYLAFAGLMNNDPGQYRINYPGSVNRDNWSVTLPLALEDLLKHKSCAELKRMTRKSAR